MLILGSVLQSCNTLPGEQAGQDSHSYEGQEDKGSRSNVESPLVIDLYIAGTHDACAFVGGGDLALCQSDDLRAQLEIGVRAFDVRLRAVGDGSGKLIAYHGIADQKQEWTKDIFPVFKEFLDQNPDQFVIVSFKEEGKPIKDTKESYQEALAKMLNTPEQDPYIYNDFTMLTTVSEVAGKIIPLHRNRLQAYDGGASTHFRGWQDDATFKCDLIRQDEKVGSAFIQDEYKISKMSAKDKMESIQAAFQEIQSNPEDHQEELRIFYISGTGALCYPNRAARILNPYTRELLDQAQEPSPGIYFLDFVNRAEGLELVKTIVSLNER